MGTNRPASAILAMFFYGTLKRGRRNHAYCCGALQMREATVQGSLYDLPEGYPALVVPEQNILAVGTAEPLHDAEAGRNQRWLAAPELEGPAVLGELYTFDDPKERLPAIDLLEGFAPEDPASPYRRVLIPAKISESTTPAWAYVVRDARGRHLPGGYWPA